MLFKASENDDMILAYTLAQRTFRYFWREMNWEYRRIVPALDLSCVKIAFSVPGEPSDAIPSFEHLWIGEVAFDGETIFGELLNDATYIPHLKTGNQVEATLNDVSDWMFASLGRVFGAFTVNTIRQSMSSTERLEHDEAWGLDFGDPFEFELGYCPPDEEKRYTNTFKDATSFNAPAEHPMCINMQPSLVELLSSNPLAVTGQDERGWTLSHNEALAGNFLSLRTLEENGVDTHVKSFDGETPLDVAERIGWNISEDENL